MKKLLFLFAFCLSFIAAEAQKVEYWGMVPYSKRAPTSTPRATDAQVWFNITTGDLYAYDRTATAWEIVQTQNDHTAKYAEMSISNDTTTISFAATTAAPVEDLTSGPISGFTLVSDSLLVYNGTTAATFQVGYSSTISFAEAANIISGWVEVDGTTKYTTRFRQTITTLTAERENVAGSALLTLQPGDLIRFMMVPSSHTGTDVLTIYEFNLNLTEIK